MPPQSPTHLPESPSHQTARSAPVFWLSLEYVAATASRHALSWQLNPAHQNERPTSPAPECPLSGASENPHCAPHPSRCCRLEQSSHKCDLHALASAPESLSRRPPNRVASHIARNTAGEKRIRDRSQLLRAVAYSLGRAAIAPPLCAPNICEDSAEAEPLLVATPREIRKRANLASWLPEFVPPNNRSLYISRKSPALNRLVNNSWRTGRSQSTPSRAEIS